MCPGKAGAHPSVLELTSVEQALFFPQGLRCSAKSEPLTYREAEQDTFIHTNTGNTVQRCIQRIVLHKRFDGFENREQRSATNEGFDIKEAAYSQASH